MDLLETILRTYHAEKYVNNFKNNGIDAFTLKVLDEEDLKIVGVEEADIRQLIIRHAANLQIPSEKKIDVVVDRQYAYLLLNIISMQLNKLYANMAYALRRDEIDACDVKLSPAVDCLQHCFISLDGRLSEFEEKVFITKKKKDNTLQRLLATLAVTSVVLFACSRYFGYLKR